MICDRFVKAANDFNPLVIESLSWREAFKNREHRVGNKLFSNPHTHVKVALAQLDHLVALVPLYVFHLWVSLQSFHDVMECERIAG